MMPYEIPISCKWKTQAYVQNVNLFHFETANSNKYKQLFPFFLIITKFVDVFDSVTSNINKLDNKILIVNKTTIFSNVNVKLLFIFIEWSEINRRKNRI